MSQNSTDSSLKPIKSAGSDPMTFFAIILQNMKNKPDVDWAVIAEKAGYNSATTARTRYGQIMRKLQAKENSAPTTLSTPSTPSPTKPQAPRAAIGSTTNRSPSKVIKQRAGGSGSANSSFDAARLVKREEWEEQRGLGMGIVGARSFEGSFGEGGRGEALGSVE